MSEEPLFRRESGRFIPTESTGSPWGENVMHGAPATGLLAWALHDLLADTGLDLARLTVDLFRAVPREPLEADAAITRLGKRIAAAETTLLADGRPMARASGLFLPLGSEAASSERLPGPEGLPEGFGSVRRSPLVHQSFTSHIELRQVPTEAAVACWFRMPMPLVDDDRPEGTLLAAALIDMGNLVANWGTGDREREGLRAINADTTLYLARKPLGEWIGLRLDGRLRAGSTDVLELSVFDEEGRVGHSSHARIAQAPPAG